MLRLILLLLIGLAVLAWPIAQETGSKSEYAALQAMASASGGPHILYATAQGKIAVGIQSNDKKDRIWILLRASWAPRLKVLQSNSTYTLTPKELDEILSRHSVSQEVAAELRAHIP